MNAILNTKVVSRRRPQTGVLHLCCDLDYNDPARETVTLAVLTQRLGWRALIASGGGSLVIEAERAAVKHARMPLHHRGPFAAWRNRVYLEALVQREKPVLVHAHGIGTVDLGCRLSRMHRLPLIVDITQPPANTPLSHRLFAHIARTSCTVRVPTEMMARFLSATFQINPALIRRIAPGIDLQTHNAAAISAERLHNLSRLWRVPEQGIVALMPMPLEPQMGHANLLQALSQIRDEKIYVIMVGSDRNAPGFRQQIESKVDELNLNGRAIMPDSCPDWPAAYWLSNVVVAANSAPRGQNIEILGAQALGRPVIATTTGANQEMIGKGETAWIIPPDDPTALAKALRAAAGMTTEQRVNLADNTRLFIEDHFPQAGWFNGMMEIYEALLFPKARAA